LAEANARISSLEAELETSRKAWDAATAEKSSKLALARAKKAEKALSDANKEHIQQEQVMTLRLNKMSALAGGKYHAFSLLCRVARSYAC
jgi:cob(I)alamin adenosyltransferase